MKIGDLHLDGKVILGPMSGVTSESYRRFMEPFGVAASVTEMTSDAGILYHSNSSEDFIDFECTRPTGLQLFGDDPDSISKAASAAVQMNPNISFIDINMGCPVPKVLRIGAGSALMKDPHKCGEIVKKVKGTVDVPVTAKIRLGQNMSQINFKEVIGSLESSGADAIALHPRTKDEKYFGRPHYDLVEGLQSEMSIPLIISGNIYSLNDAIDAQRITGAEGIMVARGGVGNPYLITQIDEYFRTGKILPNPLVSQQIDWCLELADMSLDAKGEEKGMMVMRMLAPKFIAGCHGCRDHRRDLALNAKEYDIMKEMLLKIRDELGDRQVYTSGRSNILE